MSGAAEKQRYSSGTKWEPIVGYSRAVRAGDTIYVSGTTATDADGNIVGVDDPYRQTVRVIENIRTALRALGSDLHDVVRTRIFVTDITRWQDVARAHGEFFRDVRPATTMVEVSRLIQPEMLLEIEVDARVR